MSEFRYLTSREANGVVTCTMSNPPRHTLVAAEVAELDQLDRLARSTRRRARADVHRRGRRCVHRALRSGRTRRQARERSSARRRDAEPPSSAGARKLHPFHRFILRLQRARS